MPNVVTNLIATPARILYAPLNTGLPADTVAAGAAWPAGWVEAGFTSAPLTIKKETEQVEFAIEQSETLVKQQVASMTFEAETTLAEIDLNLLAVAWGGTVVTTPAAQGQPGMQELGGGGTIPLTERMWGFEGSYPDANGAVLPIRLYIYKGNALAGGELQFAKADPAGISLRVVGLADMTRNAGDRVYFIQKVTAPALP